MAYGKAIVHVHEAPPPSPSTFTIGTFTIGQ